MAPPERAAEQLLGALVGGAGSPVRWRRSEISSGRAMLDLAPCRLVYRPLEPRTSGAWTWSACGTAATSSDPAVALCPSRAGAGMMG